MISSSEESSSSESESQSSSDEEEDDNSATTGNTPDSNFKIPKNRKSGPWSETELANIKKNWPNLKNIEDSILKNASLKEIGVLGRNKMSVSKLVTAQMASTYENVQSFPTKIEAGEDDCTGSVHSSRFLRGYVGDAQELWLQA